MAEYQLDQDIDKLKSLTNTFKDTELSLALGLSKNVVGTWRARGSIPSKYKKMVADSFIPPITSDLTAKITFYDIEASAGYGSLVESEEQQKISFSEVYLADELNVKPKDVFMMRATGDSMYPTLKDGSLMIVKYVNDLGSDGVYVFRVNGQLMVKRLQFQPIKIIFISDNANVYEPWELTHKELENIDFEIIGRVIWGGGKI